MSTAARQLAEWLSAQSDEALATLFSRREVLAQEKWSDFFDAAEALGAPAALAKTLQRLSHSEASDLIAGRPSAALRALALTDAEGVALPAVVAAAAGRDIPPLPNSTVIGVSDSDTAHAAERALTQVNAVAELLFALRDTPLALLASGAPSSAERRRLAELLPPDADAADVVTTIIEARLATEVQRALHLSEHGEQWLSLAAAQRWGVLAAGFVDALPRSIHDEGMPPQLWHLAEPWNPGWPGHAASLLRRSIALGMTTPEGGVTAWAQPPRAEELGAHLPQEVDRVFLQNDLTAVAPGPLAPPLERRLRAAADRESVAQASSYRFSAGSIARAVSSGETAESLREFLAALSLTGIPQPLDYLLERAAQHDRVVQLRSSGGRTRLRSDDPHLIETILVDQALRHLAFTVSGEELVSRVNAASVSWALNEARYGAVLLDDDGLPMRIGPQLAPTPPAQRPMDVYRPLIARLRANHGPDAARAWLTRALESAAQTREVLLVDVAMPDGSSRELTLEVTGIGGGRLRGNDRAADVERTLPISHIRSARPAI